MQLRAHQKRQLFFLRVDEFAYNFGAIFRKFASKFFQYLWSFYAEYVLYKFFQLVFRDTSGQGRFATIFRSFSRGAQGVLLVYDITNRWSFEGIRRWLAEIDEVSFLYSTLV